MSRSALLSLLVSTVSAPAPCRYRQTTAVLRFLSAVEDVAAAALSETEDGRTFLRENAAESRAERAAAAAAERAETAARRAAEWAALPLGGRVASGAVSPSVREMPLPGLGRWEQCYPQDETPRTTAVPALGTPDADGVIVERLQIVSEDETVSADGTIVCRAEVILWTGSVHYGRVSGTAAGIVEETGKVRTAARKAAETAARAERSRLRGLSHVLGTDAPVHVVSDVETRESRSLCPVSGDDYRALRRYVSRRALGNAWSGSRSGVSTSFDGPNGTPVVRQHVRAGIAALGMPLQDVDVEDGAHAAVLLLCRWAETGLPESLSETAAEWRESGQDVRPLILGSAARDGLRYVTAATRPTALAAARTRFRNSIGADPRTDGPDSPVSDRGAVVRRAVLSTAGGSTYVAAPVEDRISTAVLQRTPDGRLRFPVLAALVLSDGQDSRASQGMAAVARLLLGSDSGPARVKIKARARSEWAALQGLDTLPPLQDDSGQAVASGAVSYCR